MKKILSWLLLGAAAVCLCARLLHLPALRLFGYSVAAIRSGSMAPAIEKGDVVVMYQTGDLSQGDVAAYRDGAGRLIVHRISEVCETTLTFKGDANHTEDFHPVDRSMVQGRVVAVIPRLGFLSVHEPAGKLLAGLLLFAGAFASVRSRAGSEARHEEP